MKTLCAWVLLALPAVPVQAFEPLTVDGVNAAEARGVWRSRGYGWILDVQERSLAVYQVSRAGCSQDPRTEGFAEQFAYRSVDSSPEVQTLASFPGENRYVFDRLRELPAECRRSWTSPQLFEHFVASYSEHYAFFKEHHFDFAERVRRARANVNERTSQRELFAIFSGVLDGLGDAHVSVGTRVGGETLTFRTGRGPTLERVLDRAAKANQAPAAARDHWLAAYHRGVRESILAGRFQEGAQDKFVWGRIGTDIGYINVNAVEGYVNGPLVDNIAAVNALLDRILGEFDGVRAIVLDITVNTGGYDRLAREIAGHFAAQPGLAYTKRPFGVTPAIVDEFYAVPGSGRKFLGPVYLLTSDFTVSGAEILTLTMRVLPNVTQVGTATRGALSDRLTKVLPDGSDFSISNEIYLDAHGVLFEAVGIPPHVPLEIFPASDLDRGHARAVLTLAERIRAGSVR